VSAAAVYDLAAYGPRVMTSKAEIRRFMLAGNARLTLRSLRSGAHFTYRVARAKDQDGASKNLWFVSVLSGPDNETDYSYAGLLEPVGDALPPLRLTAKSRVGATAPSVVAWNWFLGWLQVEGWHAPSLEVRHEGRCGRCGRLLTHPDSLDRGIGPECWAAVGGGR
jgi:hypothetical protein